MLSIICCLCGIFVGLTTSWYFQIKPIAEKDAKISKLKRENDDLRHEKDDLQEDLSIANKEIEMKDRYIETIKTILEQNSYGRDDLKIAKLKEVITSANVK